LTPFHDRCALIVVMQEPSPRFAHERATDQR
jgi:hypothetical protein